MKFKTLQEYPSFQKNQTSSKKDRPQKQFTTKKSDQKNFLAPPFTLWSYSKIVFTKQNEVNGKNSRAMVKSGV